jgi:DNA topoisomerase-1
VVLAEKKAGGGRPGRGAATAALKELGEHPTTGKPVRLLAGRYGPYIKHEATNANIPKGADPDALTLEEAVALLAARESAPSGKKKPARRATAAKAPAKAATATATAKPKAKPAAKSKAKAKAGGAKPAAKAKARKTAS